MQMTNCGELCKRHTFIHVIERKCSNLCSLLLLIVVSFIAVSKQNDKYLYC